MRPPMRPGAGAQVRTTPDVVPEMQSALWSLLAEHPFFAHLALRLPLVADPAVERAATDGRRIRVNPTFCAGLDLTGRQMVLAHEVLHPALGHFHRLAGADDRLKRAAMEQEINNLLSDASPDWEARIRATDGVLDRRFRGMMLEGIYAALLAEQPPPPPPGNHASGDDETGQGPGGSPGNHASGDDRPKAAPHCGCCDGPQRAAPSQSPAEASQEAADWESALLQATARAQQAGKLPAVMQRLIEALREPAPEDWRALLARWMEDLAGEEYGWRRPSRRALGAVRMPSPETDPEMPPLVVVCDTSGSIDPATLHAMGERMQAILDDVRPEALHVVWADADVAGTETYQPGDVLALQPCGGGGTDFRPAFRWVEEKGIQPAGLVYLTDLDGPFPDHPPVYPVLWAATTGLVVPWGEVIRLQVPPS